MKQIGDYTFSALTAAAPANNNLDALLTTLSPLLQAYAENYDTWLSRQGLQKGRTQSLNDLLKELGSEIIQEWDLAIQNEYRQDTPQYTALLPRYRQPFQNGSQEDRITAVGALSLAIGDDTALQSLKTEVDSLHDALVTANFTQKGSKSMKSGSSDELEASRIGLGQALYGVLGMLMNLYKDAPESIASFFLMDELRSREQTTFRRDIDGDETLLVFVRSFEDGEAIRLTNRGNTDLKFARVPQKTDTMPGTALILPAGQQTTVNADALGTKDNRFFIVQNVSASEKGAYTVKLM